MGEALVEQNQLEQIGNYVKHNIGNWLREQNLYPFPPQERGLDKELLERMIRVEEGLKFQGEKLEQSIIQNDRRFNEVQQTMNKRFETMQQTMDKRFENMQQAMNTRFNEIQHTMDKRFEAVDKRFEAVDKRFETVDKRFEDMDKRFSQQFWFMSTGFVILGLMISVYQFLS